MLKESVANILKHNYPLDGCQLIAREIESLADEELEDVFGKFWQESLDNLKKNEFNLRGIDMIRLLDKGVLPPQFERGFEDGSVRTPDEVEE